MPSFDGDETPSPEGPLDAPPINEMRDAYLEGMRKLIQRVNNDRPPDLDGILGRAETLMETQTLHLDRLELLDLEGGSDPQEVFRTLLRAQQLPRMIHAMGEVLVQQEKDSALRASQVRCLELARELLTITHLWLSLHQDELDETEEF